MSLSALVTGGSHGLGAAIVRALHAEGFNVVIGDVDADQASALANEIDASGASVLAVRLDVRDQNDFEACLAAMVERWGGAQVLVNNAVITAAQPVLDIRPADFDDVMRVNVGGAFIGSQVFGRAFAAAGYGRIVNIASLAGQNGGTATGAHYAASKGAIITLTKVFARDLAAHGVTVNAIAPGPLDLPSVRRLVPEERLAGLIEDIPVRRLGDPAYIAELVCLLASERSGFTTGATWDVNGGLLMR